MAAVDLATYESLPDAGVVVRAGDAYLDVFSREPYNETPDDRAAFVDRVERMAVRDGFRLVVAWERETVAGLGLAAVAHPGDWWRDRVAKCLEEGEVEEWLGSACLEVVHLAVRPRSQGRGIRRAIHDALLEAASAPTAVLTVHPAAAAARRLYAREGWRVLRTAATIGASRDVTLMGRRLEHPRAGA
jgi:GNAT superfamily N-acetyltransferase